MNVQAMLLTLGGSALFIGGASFIGATTRKSERWGKALITISVICFTLAAGLA